MCNKSSGVLKQVFEIAVDASFLKWKAGKKIIPPMKKSYRRLLLQKAVKNTETWSNFDQDVLNAV